MPASVLNVSKLWKKNELARWLIFFSIAIVFTIIDLLTKYFTFETSTRDIIPGILGFKSVINKGIIWGLFSQGSFLFVVIPCLAIPLIIIMFKYIYIFVSPEPEQKDKGQTSDSLDDSKLARLLNVSPEKTIKRLFRPTMGGILTFASGLILAGAAGNLYDRIVYKGVRDFINFYVINWPIFNLADAYITIGAILIVISMFKKPPVAKISSTSTDTNQGL